MCFTVNGEERGDPARIGFFDPDTPGMFRGAVDYRHFDRRASKNGLDVPGDICGRGAVGQEPLPVCRCLVEPAALNAQADAPEGKRQG